MIDVFLIHGAGGASWEWDTWIAVYAIEYRTKYLNLRPLDLLPSDRGLEYTSFDDYIDQVKKKIAFSSDFVLVGASMGGIIALKVAEILHPKALVIVSSSLPGDLIADRNSLPPFPSIIRWAPSLPLSTSSSTCNTTVTATASSISPVSDDQLLLDTVKALPDSTRDMHLYAWKRWRDESGLVMNQICSGDGILIDYSLLATDCPRLAVIPEEDDTIPAAAQQLLATRLGADTLRFAHMSHVGPLLSVRAAEVAVSVFDWIHRRIRT
eukprot:gene26352-34988_t